MDLRWVEQGTGPSAPAAHDPQVVLARSHLQARLHREDGLTFLDVTSRLAPSQSFLLSLTHEPLLAGIAAYTPLGRMHAVSWALAFGVGPLPDDSVVRFEPAGHRYATTVEAWVQPLTEQHWVAEAVGVFSSCVIVVGSERARVRLSHP